MTIDQSILERPWGLSKESDTEKVREMLKLEPDTLMMGELRSEDTRPPCDAEAAPVGRPTT